MKHKPGLVRLAVVVGAGVRAPTRAPNSPPGAAVVAGAAVEGGAAVVAGTAVLGTSAAGTELGFQRPQQIPATQDRCCCFQPMLWMEAKLT